MKILLNTYLISIKPASTFSLTWKQSLSQWQLAVNGPMYMMESLEWGNLLQAVNSLLTKTDGCCSIAFFVTLPLAGISTT